MSHLLQDFRRTKYLLQKQETGEAGESHAPEWTHNSKWYHWKESQSRNSQNP